MTIGTLLVGAMALAVGLALGIRLGRGVPKPARWRTAQRPAEDLAERTGPTLLPFRPPRPRRNLARWRTDEPPRGE
jgi:hypothetical protein